jgi:UDP-3-O-[3-hydroxymyristoyl] glucosamine N-acyltransferase
MTALLRLAAVAERFGLELRGDGSVAITGVATLTAAEATQISFLSNPAYRKQLPATRAAGVVLRADDAALCPVPALVSANPYADFARIASLFDVRSRAEPGIHPSAVVEAGASIAASASIGPFCHVAADARIGEDVEMGPGCSIGEGCEIGEGSRLVARVTLVTRVRLGKRVLVHPGAVLGADGFGLAMDAGHWLKVPQLGGVRIGDDCEIGANTCIDRGALDDTVLEEDVHLDNQIQIGHGVHIGAHTVMAGFVGVAGSARIGRYCLIGGGAGVVGHIEICDRVTVTARSVVTHSIHQPGEYSSGTPIQDNRSWRRNAVRFKQLDAMAQRLNALEKDQKA